jgi:serine/threonine protein kinase
MKEIHLKDDSYKTDARKEAYTLLRMKGKKIFPELLAFHTTPTTAILVMEYMPGSTLKDWMATLNADSRKDYLSIVDSLYAVLERLHNNGLVHYDIKPDNILVIKGSPAYSLLLDAGSTRPIDTCSAGMGSSLAYGYSKHRANGASTATEKRIINSARKTSRYCAMNTHYKNVHQTYPPMKPSMDVYSLDIVVNEIGEAVAKYDAAQLKANSTKSR